MRLVSPETLLMIGCGLVILSYLFSMLSMVIRVPSVLLLLFAGVGFRFFTDSYNINLELPASLVETLGVVGLIMIVLEAGLDLKLSKDKTRLIRDSFFSALVLLVLSTALLTGILYYWLHEPLEKCMAYAIPLSIMSSSIVIPSLHPLSEKKREFLVYEASFSDILGILAFNYLLSGQVIGWKSLGVFSGSVVFSIVLSLVLSFVLFFILARTRLNIKFFLVFALLILIYMGGKIFHLPSLIIIIVFGMMIKNWELLRWPWLQRFFPVEQVNSVRHLLHSITAESSFLIRTFFFILFGYSIQLNALNSNQVVMVGSMIVVALFIVRLLYLRFFVKTNVFPESFLIPRGLVTIVLYYKIPEQYRLSSFDEGILFFIILTTAVIMTIGMIFYKKKPDEIIEESQFAERGNIS